MIAVHSHIPIAESRTCRRFVPTALRRAIFYRLIGSGGTVNGQFTRGGSSHSSNLFTMDFDADEFTGQFDVTDGNIVITSGSSSSSGGSGSGTYTVEGVSDGVGTISEGYSVSSGSSSVLGYKYLPPSDIAAPDSATPGEDSQGSWELVSGETGSGFTASSGNSSSVSGTWDQSNDGASSGLSWDISGTFDSSRSNSSESSESVSSTYNGQDWVESSESRSESLNTTSNSYDSKDGTVTGQVSGRHGPIDVTGTLTASGERTSRQQTSSSVKTTDGTTTENESFTLYRNTNVSEQSSEISGSHTWDYGSSDTTHYEGEEKYSYSQHNNVDELDETKYTRNFSVTTETTHSTWDNSVGSETKYSDRAHSDDDRTRIGTDQSFFFGPGRIHHSTSKSDTLEVRNSSNNTDSFGSITVTQVGNGPETTSGEGSVIETRSGEYESSGDHDYTSRTDNAALTDYYRSHDQSKYSSVESFSSTSNRTTNYATGKTSWGTDRDADDQPSPEEGDGLVVNQVSGNRSSEIWSDGKDAYGDDYSEYTDQYEYDEGGPEPYSPTTTSYDTTVDYSGYYKHDPDDPWDSWYRSNIDTPGHNGVSAGYSAPSATGADGSMQSIADADTYAAETVGGSGGGGGSVSGLVFESFFAVSAIMFFLALYSN